MYGDDWFDQGGPPQEALLVMLVLSVLVLVAALGCAERPFRPETPHPSPERIAQLAHVDQLAPEKESGFHLEVTPRVILQGGAAWVTCYVPKSYGAGRVQLALGEVFSSEQALNQVEIKRLADGLACGTYVATCTILTARGAERREAQLEVKGGMCDGS